MPNSMYLLFLIILRETTKKSLFLFPSQPNKKEKSWKLQFHDKEGNGSSKVTPGISVSSMFHDNGSFTLQQEVKSSASFFQKLTTFLSRFLHH